MDGAQHVKNVSAVVARAQFTAISVGTSRPIVTFCRAADAALCRVWNIRLALGLHGRRSMTLPFSADLPAAVLLEKMGSEKLSPLDAMNAALQRVEHLSPQLNAFSQVDAETSIQMARAAAERYATRQIMGRIDGLPVAIKDAFDMRSWPTYNGTEVGSNAPAAIESPSVAACRRNGFVPVGKTTTPEMGWKAVTDSPLTGVTRNPWDPSKTCGGSSGGSAVAVATGMAALATGADSGGSVRIPASFCGVVGFKPTHGRAPMHPGSHYGKLSQPGPLARTVSDAALLLDVMSEQDPQDPRLGPADAEYRHGLRQGVQRLRFAYSPTLGLDVDVDPEVARAVAHVADKLSDLGARVVEIDPPVTDLREEFQRLFFGVSAMMAADWSDATRARLDPGHRRVIEHYEAMSGMEYMQADSARVHLMQQMSMFHRDYDLVLTPTVPILPFEAGCEVPPGWPHPRWTTWTPFTWPFNMTGQPAISVPCGFSDSGLPIGAQLIGGRHDDALVLRAAHTLQQVMPLTHRRPPALDDADAASSRS